jgi:mono/diheme cytochrome c family protein
MGWARRIGVGCGAVIGLVSLTVGGAVAYAFATADGRLAFPDAPYPALAASTDPELIARGEYLFRGPAHCIQCHAGNPDRRHPELVAQDGLAPSGGLEFAMGPVATTWAANLTPDHATGIGARTDAELARAMRTGVLHDGTLSIFMRYSASKLADEDVVAILSFLRAQAPVRNEVARGYLGPLGKLMAPLLTVSPGGLDGPAYAPPSDEPSLERGRYLAESVALCVGCHSEFDMATFENVGPKAGGGTCEPSHGEDDADMEFCPPNLTSSPHGITGKLDEDAFVARMRAGRTIPSSIMPWEGFGRTTEADLRSIYRYLRALPPVDRDTGPPYRPIGWQPAN